jgi:hypothetical protein
MFTVDNGAYNDLQRPVFLFGRFGVLLNKYHSINTRFSQVRQNLPDDNS